MSVWCWVIGWSLTFVVDYIESGIVPATIQMLDPDSPDEFRAEGVMVSNADDNLSLLTVVYHAAVVW